MFHRLELFLDFARTSIKYATHVGEVILSLLAILVFGGVTISHVEGISLIDAIYFAFVTGLSIGYGDITPETTLGKVLSVAIGITGMLFVGITVAICNRALADTAKRHMDATP